MKLNLKAIARSMGMALQKHSPEILTGIGIAGMVTTTILAVRATPKALLLIQEAEDVYKRQPYLFLEIEKGMGDISRKKYVLLRVNTESYIPHD